MARTPVTVPRLEHHQVALMNAFILVKLRLKPGDALFIPSFWLHYVHGSSSPKSSQRRGADSEPIPWLSMNLFFTHRIRPTFRPQQDRYGIGAIGYGLSHKITHGIDMNKYVNIKNTRRALLSLRVVTPCALRRVRAHSLSDHTSHFQK